MTTARLGISIALRAGAALLGLFLASGALAQPVAPLLAKAKQERPAFLATLQRFVEIESGSNDREGLDRMVDAISLSLAGVGGKVDVIDPAVRVTRLAGQDIQPGRMVRAAFPGGGGKKILLIAHMDTVYRRGQLAQQPYRIEGNRAYGLGIGDDKQGVALIVHTIALLRALAYDKFGTITVLINGDEEIGSPGSRKLITELAAAHDVTMSFEGSEMGTGPLSLATAAVGSVRLVVRGTASHAGVSPDRGVNAIDELAHQILQLRDLSDKATGTKLNWTLAQGGTNINVIPASAEATADMRVLRVEDYAVLEEKIRSRVKNQLLPQATVEVSFFHGRPPLAATPASVALASHAQDVYRELGLTLDVKERSSGGGTDAAYAALQARGPVIESWGLQCFGSHSASKEYVALDSIEPRLYLAARIIMDISEDKVHY
jgi:glutamate carboxypeptidase